ncbi:hypothetical protein N7510_000304 [Penicillium lagena]|uniref:uncharacterized protein n=1 Tax=Penicillium lagena TaxID=94218 RepID=UPI002541BAA6|nr:uncharacterized protein N7510_000304 [Penicillium lagena]KAJ5623995.1 hypothetical protein N7510_000304 [Penicillium lagena]
MATLTANPTSVLGLDRPIQDTFPDGFAQNGGRISTNHVGMLRPTPASLPIEEMRERLKQDGYLFVKGLLPREDVLDAREHYFNQYSGTSLLEPGTSPRDGIFNKSSHPDAHKGIGGEGLPVDPAEEKILVDAHKESEYRAFIEHPALTKFIREFMEWKEHRLLDRSMLRHNVPFGKGTGIHYDKLFLRAGDGFFLTAWVPIGNSSYCTPFDRTTLITILAGDIPINGGGLCYLANSVGLGRAIENDFNTRAAAMTQEERVSAFNVNMMDGGMIASSPQQLQEMHSASGLHEWLITNYEAGDVVFHHPYSIHASGRNEDQEGRIRLSTDLRFYDKDDQGMDTRWCKIWTPGDGL